MATQQNTTEHNTTQSIDGRMHLENSSLARVDSNNNKKFRRKEMLPFTILILAVILFEIRLYSLQTK